MVVCPQGAINYSPILSGQINRGTLNLLGTPQPSDGVFSLGDEISATFDANLICYSIENKVRMVTLDSGRVVALLQPACGFNKLVIEPQNFEWCELEDRYVTVTLTDLLDEDLNTTAGPISWTFLVDRQTNLNVVAVPTDATGMNNADGSIQVGVSLGVGPYDFKWSNGSTSQNQTGLLPGKYYFTVTDQDCARYVDSVTVSYPGAPTCSDGLMNGNETGVDCGGDCGPCPEPGSVCTADSLTVDQNYIEDTLYHAGVHLSSAGVVDPVQNERVTFKAGTSIALRPGFHAQAGSDFRALIEACPAAATFEEPLVYLSEQAAPADQKRKFIPGLFVMPNPFRSNAYLNYILEEEATVWLGVFGPSGELIEVLLDGVATPAGQHRLLFDGGQYPPGMYYVTLKTKDQVVTRKMVLIQ